MAARSIDGPEKDWLDINDLCHLLRMSEGTVRNLIRKGQFPKPLHTSPQGRFWPWEVVVWWRLNVMLGLTTESKPEHPGHKPEHPGDDDALEP